MRLLRLKAFNSAPVLWDPKSEDEGDAVLSAAALRFLSNQKGAFSMPQQCHMTEGWIFGVRSTTRTHELGKLAPLPSGDRR